MFSKWKIWDYLASNDNIKLKSSITAFHCFDPLAFKIIKEKFDRSQFFEGRLNVLLGKEVTTSWVEDNLKSLNLFGNSESYLIHNAEDLGEEVRSLLLEENLVGTERFIILSFNKEDKFLKKIKKDKPAEFNVVSIQAPAFWEDDTLLSFLTKYFELYLDYESLEYFKAKVPFEIQKYYQHLEQLSLVYGKSSIKKSDLEEVLDTMKFDTFKLVELFGSKMLRHFYDLLIEATRTGEDLIGPLYFLQSHIHKMYDQSYMEKKSKLTKYDKQIIQQAKLWNKSDLVKAQAYIGSLLIEIKRKDPFLIDHLKLSRAKTIKI